MTIKLLYVSIFSDLAHTVRKFCYFSEQSECGVAEHPPTMSSGACPVPRSASRRRPRQRQRSSGDGPTGGHRGAASRVNAWRDARMRSVAVGNGVNGVNAGDGDASVRSVTGCSRGVRHGLRRRV